MGVIDVAAIRMRYEAVAGHLNERARRLFAAREARAAGRGGIAAVASVTGIARSTIERGLKDLDREAAGRLYGRIRRRGGGRKAATVEQPGLRPALRRLVATSTRGDPRATLLWVSRSQRQLAAALAEQGYRVSPNLVGRLLKDLGFSLQANAKSRRGRQHPDRDAQFQHINAAIEQCRRDRQPAISVDTKENELVRDFKNAGRELRRKRRSQTVRVRDFVIAAKVRAAPYDDEFAANQSWVGVGIDHDTAAFAVESIRRWLRRMGRKRYPKARRLLVTADCGGSDDARVRLWKLELQGLANHTRLAITVAHHPPGPSKWNRIDHRMVAFVGQNWRGKPLLSHKVIVRLIGASKTTLGPTVTCFIDAAHYPIGGKITGAQLDALNIRYDAFHPDWNYTLLPKWTQF